MNVTTDDQRRLSVPSMSIDECERWISIALSAIPIVRHDIAGSLQSIEGAVYNALHDLETAPVAPEDSDAVSIHKRLEHIRLELRCLDHAFNCLSVYGGSEGTRFAAKPAAVVRRICKLYPAGNISTPPEVDASLEILFPENVLTAMLTELVNNAIRHSAKDNTTISIKWQMQGEHVSLTVDDDGMSCPVTLQEKHIPLDLLMDRTGHSGRQRGLSIINRAVRTAGGLMLFSKSRDLGGLLVTLKLPIQKYYSDSQ